MSDYHPGWVRAIQATAPLIGKTVYDEAHVERFFEHIAILLTPDDVTAITIHRGGEDYRYEWAASAPRPAGAS